MSWFVGLHDEVRVRDDERGVGLPWLGLVRACVREDSEGIRRVLRRAACIMWWFIPGDDADGGKGTPYLLLA